MSYSNLKYSILNIFGKATENNVYNWKVDNTS